MHCIKQAHYWWQEWCVLLEQDYYTGLLITAPYHITALQLYTCMCYKGVNVVESLCLDMRFDVQQCRSQLEDRKCVYFLAN